MSWKIVLIPLLALFLAACGAPATASEEVAPAPGLVLSWEGRMALSDDDTTRCHELRVFASGEAEWNPCGGTPRRERLGGGEWEKIVSHLAPFTLGTAEARLRLDGQGEAAGNVWQRALADWAKTTYSELSTGHVCASCHTVLVWSFGATEAEPGLCETLWVTSLGYAYHGAAPCEGGPSEIVAEGWLLSEEWTEADSWLRTRATTYAGPNNASYLAGQGAEPMGDAEIAGFEVWANGVRARLKG